MLELPESSPVSNRTRKKSKAGCKTCKIRRVKVGRHLDKSCMCHWLITCSAMRRIPFVATVKYITVTELRAANMISEPRNTRSQRRPRPKHPLLEIAVFPRITCYFSTFKSLSHKAERYFLRQSVFSLWILLGRNRKASFPKPTGCYISVCLLFQQLSRFSRFKAFTDSSQRPI
jgi:hypothetical protein